MARKILSVRFVLISVFGMAGVLLMPSLVKPRGTIPGFGSQPPVIASSPEVLDRSGLIFRPRKSPPFVPICKIQGSGFTSSYEGQQVRTQGIVFADLDQTGEKGFYIQDPDCDTHSSTSNGLLIYLGLAQNSVETGDLVEVAGIVQEHFGLTELASSPAAVTVISGGNEIPLAVELNPPFDNFAARGYFESLEGMAVKLSEGTVVGPTGLFGDTWLIRTDLGIERLFYDQPGGTGVVIRVDGEGLADIEPAVSVGDQVENLAGALGFRLGDYRLHLLQSPVVYPATSLTPRFISPEEVAEDVFSFEAATFNVKNLFDTVDDPDKEDPVRTAAAYQRHLGKLGQALAGAMGKPGLVGLQEVENSSVLNDLLARPELEDFYDFVHFEGPDRRGIDVALLYHRGSTRLISESQSQGCTDMVDGLGPDGNLNLQDPHNELICDSDGDGTIDGNRLFSRPPLVVELQVCEGACLAPPGVPPGPSKYLWVIVAHLKSKTQDTDWNQYTLPRRLEQAAYLTKLAREIAQKKPDANLVILGDFNDYPDSPTLATLREAGFVDLSSRLASSDRYTYIYRGVSQVLDYAVVNDGLLDELIEPRVAHINVDYPELLGEISASPYRSSDHDPLIVQFSVLPHRTYLPITAQSLDSKIHQIPN